MASMPAPWDVPFNPKATLLDRIWICGPEIAVWPGPRILLREAMLNGRVRLPYR